VKNSSTGQARLGGYTLNVTYERPSPSATQGAQASDAVSGGLAITVGPDEFLYAGTGLVVTFDAHTPGPPLVGILSVQEGKFVNGQWQPGRWLNGDQTHQGRHLRLPPGKFDLQRIKLYRYRRPRQANWSVCITSRRSLWSAAVPEAFDCRQL